MKEETTIDKIRVVWDDWAVNGRTTAWVAMKDIGVVLAEEEERERRLKTIAEDARRDRELRAKGAPV